METVITSEFGSVKVTFRLYGEVTPERITAEQRMAKHRAEQLGSVYTPARRPYVPADVRLLAASAGRYGDNFDGVDWD